ncbi:MCE family protein [Saccharomonospora iraqiensis]|uniref:MCE family protein n=1 Tax=Saccharomonospora iraqiensis TaxID=52698 RepID=UPI00022E5A46|nr:MCE family protein [Saccharomonospora iraqiensis]
MGGRGEPGRAALAARGLAVLLTLVVAAGVVLAAGEGAFDDTTVVTTTLPSAAGPVRIGTPVQYRGVTVGTVDAVTADGPDAARATLRLDPGQAARVPGNVRTRLLPRTVFGDTYVDLTVTGEAEAHGHVAEGAYLPPDSSRRTVRLYTVYTRLHGLLTELNPAELQVALTTLADTLRGRGAELGRMIDDVDALVDQVRPSLDSLGADLTTVAELGAELAAATPDALATLDNAVALSGTVVAEREAIGAVLSAGTELGAASRRFLADNGDRFIELTRLTEPLTAAAARPEGAISDTIAGADHFLDGARHAFGDGAFSLDAALTFDRPHPYTAADCPRYPGRDGPNCTGESGGTDNDTGPGAGAGTGSRGPDGHRTVAGGTVGPVGGAAEKDAVRTLAPLLPHASDAPGAGTGADDRSTDLLTLMLGPLLRGNRVVVP